MYGNYKNSITINTFISMVIYMRGIVVLVSKLYVRVIKYIFSSLSFEQIMLTKLNFLFIKTSGVLKFNCMFTVALYHIC